MKPINFENSPTCNCVFFFHEEKTWSFEGACSRLVWGLDAKKTRQQLEYIVAVNFDTLHPDWFLFSYEGVEIQERILRGDTFYASIELTKCVFIDIKRDSDCKKSSIVRDKLLYHGLLKPSPL